MKENFLFFAAIILLGFKGNSQFTFTNNEAQTNNEIVAPVLRLSNEFRLPNTFAANDPTIGTLDNTGYGINIHKTEGIGFAFNNVHRVFFSPSGNIRTSSSNPSIHIEGTGTGNYQGANLILSAKGVTPGNKHVSTWFMTHRSTDGTASIEMQRRGMNSEYNGSLVTYKDGQGWRFDIANSTTSGLDTGLSIDNFGNTGIGTSTPKAKLHVNSNADVGRGQDPAFLIGSRNGLHIAIDNNEIGAFSNNVNSNLHINGSQSTSHTIINGDGTGNVGIGTMNPTQKLDIIGTIKSDKLLLNDPNNTSDWNTLWQSGFYQSYNATNLPEPNQWFWGINMNHSSNNPEYRYNGQIVIKNNSVHPKMYFRSTNKEGTGTWARLVHSVGNQYIEGALGIGTNTPDAKLTVKGNIHTQEVKVDLNGAVAPDYVFLEDYDLKTINEVEAYIKDQGHLPNIPSAAEMEQNGIELKQMNLNLLEKIEELTLYTISQEKQLKDANNKLITSNARIQTLETKNNELETRLEKLEKLITKE
ncbi:tail fiber protein [Aquimarina latercula]|uniref:tail fiber protein n=1 Tax=Aquimarina latercula TaxID=987 RepID=UPI00040AED4E|nr:tail fiber protein [Aquimarina latercula]